MTAPGTSERRVPHKRADAIPSSPYVMMLAIGLLVTLGIGSSFSTIPIIATVFVPLAFAITAVCAPLSSVSPCPESV